MRDPKTPTSCPRRPSRGASLTLIPLILCLAGSAAAEPPPENGMKNSNKTLHPELVFVDGPQLTDLVAFGAWFEAAARAGGGPPLRLPVIIELDRRTGLSVGAAFVGVDPAVEGYQVTLTDRMGISLSSHLRTHCAKDARHCGLWLQGYPSTGDAILSVPGYETKGPVFDVKRVVSGFTIGQLPKSTRARVAKQ